MNVSFDDFATRLSQNLPGSTKSAVRSTFSDVARTFYRRTRAWKETLGGFDMTEGRTSIPLHPVDQNCTIVFVDAVWSNGQRYRGYRIGELQFQLPWLHANAQVSDGTTLEFTPAPRTSTEPLYIRCSVQPMPGSDVLPESALTHHYEALISGTLGAMMSVPEKPYTNLQLAEYHGRRFETEISRAIAALKTGYGQHEVPWRYNTVPLR